MWPSSYCRGRASFPWGTTRKPRAGRPKSVCWAPRTFGGRHQAGTRLASLFASDPVACVQPGRLGNARHAEEAQMRSQTKLIQIILGAVIIVAVAVGAGYGATATGSQTVTITAANAIEITVPGTASIGANAGVAGGCGTANTSITLKSNKVWSMQVRANAAYNNGKAKNGSVELTNQFQWSGDNSSFSNITTSYVDVFTGQAKTGSAGVAKTVYYKQCVTYDDDAGDYTIVAEYQASN